MADGEAPRFRSVDASDWTCCREIAREHGRSFFLASRALPHARRQGVLATYAYCRVADDIVDRAESTGPEGSAEQLASWQREIASPEHPVAVAFAHTRERYGVPVGPVHDLLEGIRIDLAPPQYATWEVLRRYCHLVAGTVGLMVAPILGCREQGALRFAAELGIAMQLTNILRDVAEDTALGRLYLPLDEIAAFGCDPAAILAGRPGPKFRDLMAFQVTRARSLYADAMRGVPSLAPSGQIATLAASHLYAGILNEFESMDYDVFQGRAYLSSRSKVNALAAAATSYVRISGGWHPLERPSQPVVATRHTAPARPARSEYPFHD